MPPSLISRPISRLAWPLRILSVLLWEGNPAVLFFLFFAVFDSNQASSESHIRSHSKTIQVVMLHALWLPPTPKNKNKLKTNLKPFFGLTGDQYKVACNEMQFTPLMYFTACVMSTFISLISRQISLQTTPSPAISHS